MKQPQSESSLVRSTRAQSDGLSRPSGDRDGGTSHPRPAATYRYRDFARRPAILLVGRKLEGWLEVAAQLVPNADLELVEDPVRGLALLEREARFEAVAWDLSALDPPDRAFVRLAAAHLLPRQASRIILLVEAAQAARYRRGFDALPNLAIEKPVDAAAFADLLRRRVGLTALRARAECAGAHR